ncbi:hypothetical protein BH708_17800 [Brachybacterium sp. P6-10-X1]|uniref:DUF4031 domain-containing protein n=1 Tax=Brachybacterium sp. P6-10-X1 TaxID=1903186 RepID=UPI000971B969|nr:DUF4031 domain-containing protein [Brachybacterium sp. P6-10-X1]APX34252.1 hypothetical protein BH708_17800 [Brachybacterium sp. P6-10-X1]
MTVYADTPRWPRHGMVWGHLISDTSLTELHGIAARAALPPRSFDLDHYDWPEPARTDLEAVGVRFVEAGELTRILIRSGLRIRLVDRPAARARRSAEHAAQLGLAPVPQDLIWGPTGHVDPLPLPHEAAPGAFRMTRDDPAAPPRVEAHEMSGRRAAAALLEELDELSQQASGRVFIGQVLGGGD